jgi:diketogulonate reductase-like aldo/keto reductase
VRWVGVSNASVDQLDEARGIVDIVGVQNQLALDFTSPIAKGEVAWADDHGVAFLPWSPLGGIGKADGTADVSPVAAAAEAHGVSPQQVVLAWLLALSPCVIPIPGSSRPETITDSARAVELALSEDEAAAISAAVA